MARNNSSVKVKAATLRSCAGSLVTAAFFALCFLPAAVQAVELRIVDPLEPVYDAESALEAPSGDVLLLAAPRNGAASAQAVILGEGAGDITAEVSILASGEYELPSEAVKIRYAHKEQDYQDVLREERETGEPHPEYGPNYLSAYYDRLFSSPQPGAEVQPVWVTITVPEDTPAGVYTGTFHAGGASAPVRLHVSDWLCPDPSDFVTHVGVISSHEALARHYEVEFWSDMHWLLIEQQLRLMGLIGVDEIWLHANADMGQGEGLALIHFTEQDGKIVPDLTVARRYVELFAKHVGKPSYVIMNYWMGPPRGGDMGWSREGIRVFVDGEKTLVPRPELGGGSGRSHGGNLRYIDRPEVESGEEFWRRVIDGVRELVQEQDWPEELIHIGMFDDQRPKLEAVDAWHRIAPGMAWVTWTHGKGDRPLNTYEDDEPIVIDGMLTGGYTHAYIPGPFGYRETESVRPYLQGGWNQGKPIRASGRNQLVKYMRPNQFRNFPNGLMVGSRETGHDGHGGSAGFGFLALDFWTVAQGVDGRRRTFIDRRHSNRLHRQNTASVIEPGPDGPVSTVRFEMLREGLQETEARCAVERALVEGRFDDATTEKARELLTEMFRHRFDGYMRTRHMTSNVRTGSRHLWGVAEYPRWIELTARLYDMAGLAADSR